MDPHDLAVSTAARLAEAGVPTEVRVATVRAAFGRTRLRAVGRVWRLGAVCLDSDGGVWATGEVLSVTAPTHPNHRSALALERNERRAALVKAGVEVGATAVVDARPLDLAAPEPPLVATPGGLGVLWTPGGAPIAFDAYVRERADLLVDPPERA